VIDDIKTRGQQSRETSGLRRCSLFEQPNKRPSAVAKKNQRMAVAIIGIFIST
jgi:hypothetical protein